MAQDEIPAGTNKARRSGRVARPGLSPECGLAMQVDVENGFHVSGL
jgi:hypothetical protein